MNGSTLSSEDKTHIVIADDDPSVRFLLKHILEKEGYRTLDASNGVEALSHLENYKVNMVLLDAVMPELNGFETCKAIKETNLELPVIIITSLDDDSSVEEAFNSGADDYVTKPINWSVLKHRISRAKNNTPDNIVKEAAALATEIEARNYTIRSRPRFDILSSNEVSTIYSIHEINNHNKRLLKTSTSLQLKHAQQLIQDACQKHKSEGNTGNLSIQIQPFNANPVQYVNMLKGVLKVEKIPEANIECIFPESQIYKIDSTHLYNAISELNVSLHIGEFSFSLHTLNLINNCRCNAIEIDIPLTMNTIEDTESIQQMLSAYQNKDITIIGADISTPDEMKFAKEIGCQEVHGNLLIPEKTR